MSNISPALFSPSGCLTGDALMCFVSGSLHGDELALAREHIAVCPMCADSVEGLEMWLKENKKDTTSDKVSSEKDLDESTGLPDRSPSVRGHIKPASGLPQREFKARTEKINERIRHRVHSHAKSDATSGTRISYKPFVWLSVAATVALFVGVFYIFWVQNLSDKQKIARKTEPASTESPPKSEEKVDSVPPDVPVLAINNTGKAVKKKTYSDVTVSLNEEVSTIVMDSEELTLQNYSPGNPAVSSETSENVIAVYGQPGNPDSTPKARPDEPSAIAGVVVTALGVSRDKKSLGYASGEAGSGQNVTSYEIPKMKSLSMDNNSVQAEEKQVFTIVEEMPSFPGGEEVRLKFLSENMVYPQQAVENAIQGTVYVQFVVDTKGNITNIKVLRGIGGGCDEEALRVIKMMPKWHPGKQNGKPVRVLYNMTVVFKLNG